MAVALLAQTVEEAWAVIKGWVKECSEGKPSRELEAIGLASKWKLDQGEVEKLFKDADDLAKARAGNVLREPRRLRAVLDQIEAEQRQSTVYDAIPDNISLADLAEQVVRGKVKLSPPHCGC
jgi:hypothetical protein